MCVSRCRCHSDILLVMTPNSSSCGALVPLVVLLLITSSTIISPTKTLHIDCSLMAVRYYCDNCIFVKLWKPLFEQRLMPFLFIKVLAYFIDVVDISLQPYSKIFEKAIEPLKTCLFIHYVINKFKFQIFYKKYPKKTVPSLGVTPYSFTVTSLLMPFMLSEVHMSMSVSVSKCVGV